MTRFYVQHPHVSGGYAVIDSERGTLVWVVGSPARAAAVAEALEALLVEHVDMHWYQEPIDRLDSEQQRRLIKYLAELARQL